jgi:hypothetical protein
LIRLLAMALPMAPRPIKPTFMGSSCIQRIE